MAPRTEYAKQRCGVARALEVVGERWTLLIVRDAFYGVRRFGDFATHLEIPRAVLASRLKALVEEGVMARVPGPATHDEYELTEKGRSLWPVVRELMSWGDDHYSPAGPRRVFLHVIDDGSLDEQGRCAQCGQVVPVEETVIAPGPGIERSRRDEDDFSKEFRKPRQLLTPLRS